MKTLLLISLIIIKPNTQKQGVPSNTKPHQQTKIHILNPTMPTDNPINPIRDPNPKNTKLLTHQTKTK